MNLQQAARYQGELRTCCRCGIEFLSDRSTKRVCGTCKRPAVRPYCPVASLLGKPLSPRERQIGKLLVEGLPNKEIAWCLKLSIGTIKVYSSALFGKLGSRNRMHAAVMLATTAADRLLV